MELLFSAKPEKRTGFREPVTISLGLARAKCQDFERRGDDDVRRRRH